MKSLTIHNLSLQVDMPDDADPEQFIREAIELVNLTLQREPYGLGAQLMYISGNMPPPFGVENMNIDEEWDDSLDDEDWEDGGEQ